MSNKEERHGRHQRRYRRIPDGLALWAAGGKFQSLIAVLCAHTYDLFENANDSFVPVISRDDIAHSP